MSRPVAQLPRVGLLVTVLTAAALTADPVAAEPDSPQALEPARLGWTEIRLRATKLLMSAEASVTLKQVPGAGLDLREAPELSAIPPGPDVLEMISVAVGAGRKSRTEIFMDPRSGAALQRNQHDYAGRLRFRTYRYGQDGAWHWTRWPASTGEEGLPPGEWTRTSAGLRAYPALPVGGDRGPVLEGLGLLYAVAAAPLDRPGDRREFTVFARRSLQRVTAQVVDSREIKVDYDQLWPSGAVRRQGTLRPLRITLESQATGGDPEDDELELLGLRGKLELDLEPDSRAPLQLSGNVKILGRVTLKLSAYRPR